MISRMFWTGIWKLTVTKTTSVRVATKRSIGRYVIYRDIFQNILKYFELIISTFIISRMLWTGIWKFTRDVVPKGNIHAKFVVKYSRTYSHSKLTNAMSIKLAVVNVPRRQLGEQKGKELMNRVCILLHENISITNFVFKQIFFFSFKTLQDLRHRWIMVSIRCVFSVAMQRCQVNITNTFLIFPFQEHLRLPPSTKV
jgi:hypothetical protein